MATTSVLYNLLLFLLTLSSLLIGTDAAAPVCAACSNYAADLSTCSQMYSAAVSDPSTGKIKGTAIACMCVTGTPGQLKNMVNCYQCGQLSGFDLGLLESWVLTCNTYSVSGAGAALDCWNTDQRLCVPLDGVAVPGFVSSAATAPAPTSSTGTVSWITGGATTSTTRGVVVVGGGSSESTVPHPAPTGTSKSVASGLGGSGGIRLLGVVVVMVISAMYFAPF
ncbi:hypothetical protein B0H66DRAFT_639210 [Apodospora peruviana]|uniref:Uncharacterized protein n=1 Tax=Apodospora peruviana TaxID=516989 RepID=A0AAE0ID52_9PEZI|nr:hypothetical protein B0H66DRAFT_639210 [Apodospora peruviana]